MWFFQQRFRDVPIQTKLTFLAATAITLSVAVSGGIFVFMDVRNLSESKATRLMAIAETLAVNSTAAVAFEQREAAADLLRSTEGRSTVQIACILDIEGGVFAKCHREGQWEAFDARSVVDGVHFTGNGFLDVAVPISEDGERLGTLFLRESTDDLMQAIFDKLTIAILVLVISALIGVIASSQLQDYVTGPILRLAAAAERISQGDVRDVRVDHESDDEIGVLCHRFNQMMDRIQSREQALVDASNRLQELNQDLEQRVTSRTSELRASNEALQRQIEAKDRATTELRQTHAQLLEVSRRAGMADIANGVLHNIGNVLNSLNISANLISDKIRELKIDRLQRAIELLQENDRELQSFLCESDQGKVLPKYLGKLTDRMLSDQEIVLREIESLASNVEHIKDIVRAQQSHAGAFGVTELIPCDLLFDDALYFVEDSCERHEVEIVRHFDNVETIEIEKSKAIQVLVNLIKNAKESVIERDPLRKLVTLRLTQAGQRVLFQVTDNGVGIAKDRLTTIFSNGFTTKKGGHGFGLHASATTAAELGGKLSVYSEGLGCGATFTLELPVAVRGRRRKASVA